MSKVDSKFYADDKNYTDSLLLLNPAQIRDIDGGKKILYVLYLIRYDDEATDGSWQIRGCALYTGATAYLRTCGGVQPDRLSKRR
jgi:hypothetical protein